jgi:DNA polymerase I-like protein with 3'-5' exonuclease and polymerase domains
MDSLPDILRAIEETKVFAFDVEAESTTSDESDAKNPRLAKITYYSLASGTVSGCFRATPETIAPVVDLMRREDLTCVIHYWPYDGQALHYNGWIDFHDIKVNKIDTALLSWLICEERLHNLKKLVLDEFGHKMVTYKEVTKTSPTLQSIALCQTQIADLKTIPENWAKRRPYPEFDSPVLGKNAIRKILKEGQGLVKKELREEANRLLGTEECEKYKAWSVAKAGELQTRLTMLYPIAEREFREYSRDDAKWLLRLYNRLIKRALKTTKKKWIKLEMDVKTISIKMQIYGINIDVQKLDELGTFMEPLIDEFKANVFDIAKCEFNIDSPKQVSDLLWSTLGCVPPIHRVDDDGNKWPKLTPAGEEYCKLNGIVLNVGEPFPDIIVQEYLSSDRDVLERLDHPLGQAILDYRAVAKLYETYVVGTRRNLAVNGDGKLHASFNSNGTDTGRFSSSDPNMQNIPSRAKDSNYDERIQKLGMRLRQMFIAPPPDELAPEGYDLIIVDQSQIELRMMAQFTGDFNLLKIYKQCVNYGGNKFYTGDIHLNTQTKLAIPRKLAKNVNFGFNYGMREEKFARQVKMFKAGTSEYDVERAAKIRDDFFRQYGGILTLMRKLSTAFKYKNIRNFTTISGRCRHFLDERVAGGKILNAKIQGSCADLLKVCMYVIDKYVGSKYPGTRILLQIHDELVTACPKRYSQEVGILLKYIMEYAWFEVNVPLLASGRICQRWSDNSNESIPEIGTIYAEINGSPRTFDKDNWTEWVHLQEDKTVKITNKSACAHLTQEQREWCRTIIPDNGPFLKKQ